MAKVIVIGGDSTIGRGLVRALTQRGDVVYSTTRRRAQTGDRRPWIDLAYAAVSAEGLPGADVAFFAAAVNGFAAARANPVLAQRVNVIASAAIAKQLVERGTRVVFLSSTAVFDFGEPLVPADRPASSKTIYGQIKAEAEAEFLKLGQSASVVRLTKVVTDDMPVFTNWVDGLSHAQHVVAFSDLHFAPITLDDAVAALLAAADDKGGGIYQFSAAADISYVAAARYLAAKIGADPAWVHEAKAVESGIPPEEVPQHTSLDMRRLGLIMQRDPPDPYDAIGTTFRNAIVRARSIFRKAE
jgi:dTDP-4-dehydrorhamnose reductase